MRRNAVGIYFAMAFGISWLAALLMAAPDLVRGQAPPKMAGLMMFPAMLLGPSVAGVAMVAVTGGRTGLRELFGRMRRTGRGGWTAAVLIPPAAVLTVLLGLHELVSPVFTPNHFWIGFAFGIAAGFFEEIGWTGFAFPAVVAGRGPLRAGVLLGVVWSLWHLPVIDYLGSATPHGKYWLPFFLAFAAAMTGLRVAMGWVYVRTKSVLLAQAMHAASTGALAAFGPAGITAGEEALWYAVYAAALWLVVAAMVRWSSGLSRGGDA